MLVFALIAVYLWDFGAQVDTLERTRGEETLSNLAVHGAAIVENRIKSAVSILWTISQNLEDESDIHSGDVMDYLKKIVKNRKTDLIRIGVADKYGRARLTDDREADVSETEFFKQSIQGNEYISSEVIAPTYMTGRIVVAVPIYGASGESTAVVYGVIQTRDFDLYADTMWDTDIRDQYVHIIDNNGNYILRSRNKNSLLTNNNFYEDMAQANTTVPVEDIQAAIENREVIQTQIHKGDDIRYVHFAPMDINNWYVITVLTRNSIDEQIGYSRNVMITLIVKILATLLIFGGYFYWILGREKRKVENLNQEMAFRDKAFKIAASETGKFVFIYDPDEEILEFMNYDPDKIWIPQIIENFPKEFTKYFKEGGRACREIRRMLAAVEGDAKEIEGEIVAHDQKETIIYRVQMTNIRSDDQKKLWMLGMLEDITEEKHKDIRLKKEEQIRSAMLSDAIGFFEVNLSRDCVMHDGTLIESSHSFTEIIDAFVERKVHKDYRQKVREAFDVGNMLHKYAVGIQEVALEYIRIGDNGEDFWVRCETYLEKDVVTDDIIALTVIRNIHDRKLSELQLKKEAVLDPLTRAYNRRSGVEKIEEILSRYPNQTHAFVFVDLDNFKKINDMLGHLVGDTLLIDVVQIMKQHVRPKDIVLRMGGDEFVIFLVDIPKEAIGRSVGKLVEKLNLTYNRNEISETVSASMGIAVAPDQGKDFKSLYEKADAALYDVKKHSKNNFKFYEENAAED